MHEMRSSLALLCAFLLLSPAGGFAADKPPDAPQSPSQASKPTVEMEPHGLLGRIERPFRARTVPPPSLANSGRLDALLRGGNLYLSLQDAIALALENNLDIAIQRYGPELADAAVLSAEAGGFARGVSTSVTAGPSGVSVSSSGTTPGTNQNAAS